MKMVNKIDGKFIIGLKNSLWSFKLQTSSPLIFQNFNFIIKLYFSYLSVPSLKHEKESC